MEAKHKQTKSEKGFWVSVEDYSRFKDSLKRPFAYACMQCIFISLLDNYLKSEKNTVTQSPVFLYFCFTCTTETLLWPFQLTFKSLMWTNLFLTRGKIVFSNIYVGVGGVVCASLKPHSNHVPRSDWGWGPKVYPVYLLIFMGLTDVLQASQSSNVVHVHVKMLL